MFNPVAIGESCPLDEAAWNIRKSNFSCSNHLPYHCLPNSKRVPGEICIGLIWVPPNHCPVYNLTAEELDVEPCDDHRGICSGQRFQSTNVYKYTGCLNITRPDDPSSGGIFNNPLVLFLLFAGGVFVLFLVVIACIFCLCRRRGDSAVPVATDKLEGNELADLHIYTQTFRIIAKQQEKAKAEKRFQSYINRVLNNGDDEIGIVFYKGHLFSHPPGTEDAGKYSIEFYLLSLKHWDDHRRNRLLTSKIFKEFTKNFATLEREVLKQQTVCLKRDPVSFDDHAEDLGQVPGCGNIEGDNCWEKCLNFWLIVPRVQWDFFDLLYQMYTFDIFHQGMLAKFVHFFTIPTNVMLSMMFFAQFNVYGELRYGNAFSVNVSLILFGVLSLAYIIMGFIRKCILWGIATTVVLAVLYMAGNLWYYSYRTENGPWYNPTNLYTNPLIWSYGMSFLQASSHMTESQIPAFITGVTHWESLHMFFLKRRNTVESHCKNFGFIVLSVTCFPILSVSVAWFSWPHLIGTEVIYIMAGIGYRPNFFNEYFRIVEKSESFGNPVIDRFPTSHKDVMAIAPAHVESMKKSHLLSDHPTNGEVFKSIATLKLSAMYLRKRCNIKSMDEREEGRKSALDTLDIMIAARKGYYGKSNTGKVRQNENEGHSYV